MGTFSIQRCPAFGLWANAITIPMMGLSSSEIKNAAMTELPLLSVIAPATKHKLIQMIMTRPRPPCRKSITPGQECVADKAQHPDNAMTFARGGLRKTCIGNRGPSAWIIHPPSVRDTSLEAQLYLIDELHKLVTEPMRAGTPPSVNSGPCIEVSQGRFKPTPHTFFQMALRLEVIYLLKISLRYRRRINITRRSSAILARSCEEKALTGSAFLGMPGVNRQGPAHIVSTAIVSPGSGKGGREVEATPWFRTWFSIDPQPASISPTINISIVFICAFLVDCGQDHSPPPIKNDSGAIL